MVAFRARVSAGASPIWTLPVPTKLAAVMVPEAVIFLKPDISLLESTRTNLDIATVPGVSPASLFISAAEEVTKVPASCKPVDPL